MRRILMKLSFPRNLPLLAGLSVIFACSVFQVQADDQPHSQNRWSAREGISIPLPDDLPREILRPIIEREADRYNVPADLIETVIEIESGFKPRARNGSAVGLMQIMLPTARSMGFQGTQQELFDPETNIRYGAAYLAAAQDAANGDLCGTVMRYQSGIEAMRMNRANRAYCAKAKTLIALNNRSNNTPRHSVD